MEEWLFLVSGRVQGVGYRQTVYEFVKSHYLSIGGYVRNLSDGDVEVLLQGDSVMIQKIYDFCCNHPGLSRVEKVTVVSKRSINVISPHPFKVSR